MIVVSNMYSHPKRTVTCSGLVRERQYAVWSDFSEQIQSKLHLCMRTVTHAGYFRGSFTEFLCGTRHGKIYSLNFDPTGAYLVATCSNNSFFLYDPRFNRMVCSKLSAHEDGVNCATFLAPGRFATGSDDGKVALWDTRKVSAPVKLLQGHAYSVKNIEYDEKSNRLFTAAFDEQVLSWDLSSITEPESEGFDIVMRIPQVCRLKLSPDGSKLLVTTRYSCLIAVNNFDGLRIVKDMYNSFAVMNKIAEGFYGSQTRAVEMLPRDERQFLKRKKNVVSFHSAPPSFSSALSVCFHPSNNLIVYRSLQGHAFNAYETTCLYDIRNTIAHCDSELGQYYNDFPDHRMLAIKRHEFFAPNFIKEISFSPDGRLIATPVSNTVKLLAATSECLNFDLHFQNPKQNTSPSPCELLDVQCPLREHHSPVLCCAFAPRDVLLATGCMDGEIYIHQPVL